MEKLSISETQVIYDTGKSGAWKTRHGRPHPGTKGGINKGRRYTSTYAPGAYKTHHMKYNNETPTYMVHAGQINETTTLPLPTEEDWKQATSEENDIGYIRRILSSP